MVLTTFSLHSPSFSYPELRLIYQVRFDASRVSLDKDHLGDIPAMPTTESLFTAVLIKETRKRLGLT